jgi:hypothetical protein
MVISETRQTRKNARLLSLTSAAMEISEVVTAREGGKSLTANGIAAEAKLPPRAAPQIKSRRFSVRICRTTWRRLPPMARRVANSRFRSSTRSNRTPARLRQTIKSTRLAHTLNIASIERYCAGTREMP